MPARKIRRSEPGDTSLDSYGFSKRARSTNDSKAATENVGDQSIHDAKMDEGDAEQDLEVKSDDQLSNQPVNQANNQVVEHEVNIDRIRTYDSSGNLKTITKTELESIRQSINQSNNQSDGPPKQCVLYWMQREQRVNDNWALLLANEMQSLDHAINQSSKQSNKKSSQSINQSINQLPLVVAFCLPNEFLAATDRQYQYLMTGIQSVESKLRDMNVPFYLLMGDPSQTMVEFVKNGVDLYPSNQQSSKMSIACVITDFNPLRIHKEWKSHVAKNIDVPILSVDGHNIVPVWKASPQLETAARTIRPKIQRLLSQYLTEYPALKPVNQSIYQARPFKMPSPVDWKAADQSLKIDRTVTVPDWVSEMGAGEDAARKQLHDFLHSNKLVRFSAERNDPNVDVASHLSIFLHYGSISAARCVMEAQKQRNRNKPAVNKSVECFIEELLIRRELADNFCFYEPHYDSFECAKQWAKDSLNLHESDPREFSYTLGEFETGVTHDPLWNASQRQLVDTGKLHGFLRMYWAKCMLAWSSNAAAAQKMCIYLNDRYEMDGREPNGYVGIAWSMLGIHDQGWNERAVFGKVRCMNFNGCKRKFDVEKFINRFPAARVDSKGFKVNVAKAKKLDEERALDEEN